MPRKFYLDTAIWRDYFEDRSDGIRPLGEVAKSQDFANFRITTDSETLHLGS